MSPAHSVSNEHILARPYVVGCGAEYEDTFRVVCSVESVSADVQLRVFPSVASCNLIAAPRYRRSILDKSGNMDFLTKTAELQMASRQFHEVLSFPMMLLLLI